MDWMSDDVKRTSFILLSVHPRQPPHPKQNNFEILFMLSLALGIVYGKLISLFITKK